VQRAAVEALIRRAVRAPWDPATVVAVGVTLLVLAMWTLRADQPRAHASAERIDTRAVDAPLALVRERWEAESARLREQVAALAVHDATYEFARRPNFPYVDDHFGPAKLAALAVDTVLIVDAKGRPIFWRRPNDPDNRGFADAELFLAQLPKLPAPAERVERGRPVFEGIVQFRGVPALVSAIAIEPPTGSGAPRGYLIYGRAIDGAVSRRVLDGAPAGLDVMPAGDALLPAEVRIRLDRSLTPLIVTDEQRIRGYLPLVDVQGRLLRVYSASAAKPAPPVAPPVAAAERSSWPIVIGATALLLLIGGGGLWWTFTPARVVRPAPRSDVERLARALAAETHRGAAPLDERAAPGMPQVAVAEALVGLGATADEPPAPDWLQARRPSAAHMDDGARAPAAGTSPPGGSPAAPAGVPPAAGADPLRDADDHEWLIGTPDEVLLGEHESVVADALDSAQARGAEPAAEYPRQAAPRIEAAPGEQTAREERAPSAGGADARAAVERPDDAAAEASHRHEGTDVPRLSLTHEPAPASASASASASGESQPEATPVAESMATIRDATLAIVSVAASPSASVEDLVVASPDVSVEESVVASRGVSIEDGRGLGRRLAGRLGRGSGSRLAGRLGKRVGGRLACGVAGRAPGRVACVRRERSSRRRPCCRGGTARSSAIVDAGVRHRVGARARWRGDSAHPRDG
jgi:sensor domain CHASE-containing protein